MRVATATRLKPIYFPPLMNRFPSPAICALLFAAGAFVNSSPAQIMLAPPFTDHAVLQRDVPVPVWGQAALGEKITVSFRGQKESATAGPDGRWSVRLAPVPASAEGADLVVSGTSTVTLHDVVVGEVWLASGQSNIEWPLNFARDGKTAVAAANSPLVRHLKVEKTPSDLPVATVKTSGWQTATPETAGNFSAIGYFFAQALAAQLKIPVGIISSSWGGTPIESWLPKSELEKTSAWPRFAAEWQEALKVFPAKLSEYPALDLAWRKADEAERATGQKNVLPWPHPPVGPGTAYAPGGLFNGMILPFAPYALRGVIWYQGESNLGRPGEYRELFPAMVNSWRAAWPQGDFPFFFVQIPNFADGEPNGRKWAELREAQESALSLPATAMAVTLDVGDPEALHPTDKRPVGERLALIALHQIHDQRAVEWSGPLVQAVQTEGAALRVKFTHADGLTSRTTPPSGFEVAGADKVFHAATARLEGSTVLVTAPEVSAPVAVRYAWTNSPVVSLYNSAGLPAGPFRTDDW
jgi:sialate O-acetylesterase